MRLFVLLFISFSLSCFSSKQELDIYDPTLLEESWKNNRGDVISVWIHGLKDTMLSDENFFSRVAYLSSTTNFVYGNVDVADSSWIAKEVYLKKRIRHNIATVYNRYLNSCLLFDKSITWDQTLHLQDKFYVNDRILTREEVALLDQAIENVCRRASNY